MFFPFKSSKDFIDEFMVLKCQAVVVVYLFIFNQDDELCTIVVHCNAVLLMVTLYFLSDSPLSF